MQFLPNKRTLENAALQDDESPGHVLPRHTCAPVPLPLPALVPVSLPQDALQDRARSGSVRLQGGQ